MLRVRAGQHAAGDVAPRVQRVGGGGERRRGAAVVRRRRQVRGLPAAGRARGRVRGRPPARAPRQRAAPRPRARLPGEHLRGRAAPGAYAASGNDYRLSTSTIHNPS